MQCLMQKHKIVIALAVLFTASLACASPPSPTPEPTMDVIQAIGATQTAAALLLPNTATSVPMIEAPTNTPIPTLIQVIFTPTIATAAAACSCSDDSLDCSDFSSHSSAQACYEYCVSVDIGDIHKLDNDSDGSACEGLP